MIDQQNNEKYALWDPDKGLFEYTIIWFKKILISHGQSMIVKNLM
jgi:hypothetical protein